VAQVQQATLAGDRAAAAAAAAEATRALRVLAALDPVRVRYWAWCAAVLTP
jgi:hypothetical protein